MAASRLDTAAATYKVADLEALTVKAVRVALQQYELKLAPPTKPASRNPRTAMATKYYCWLHSLCDHPGDECTAMRDGLPCSHSTRDSRYNGNYDKSRVFAHVGCTHNPRCISADDAATAAQPSSFPNMPGNVFKWRVGDTARHSVNFNFFAKVDRNSILLFYHVIINHTLLTVLLLTSNACTLVLIVQLTVQVQIRSSMLILVAPTFFSKNQQRTF
jgi:hypothetical protein